MNPVFIKLWDFELKWYTLLLIVAVLLGIYILKKEVKRFGANEDFVFNMMFWSLVFGFIGARLYYVIFNWSYFSKNLSEIIQVWNGGLAIHGGIIAGYLTMVAYCKKHKVKIGRYLDFMIVPLLIAQAIGRWGNFFNSEAHGAATTAAHLRSMLVPEFVIKGMNIGGVYYTPTFYYESIACLILFIFLIIIRRTKYLKIGSLTAYYLMGYGIIRFFIEQSRTDALLIGGFKIAQIVSIVMIIIGIIILTINSKKSRFEDLYNDKSNVDKIRF